MSANWCKKSDKFLAKYPYYNAFVHTLLGMGLGFLLTYPLAGSHPVRWGVAFLAVAALGYLWTTK